MSKQRRPARAPEQQPVEHRTEQAPSSTLDERQDVSLTSRIEAGDWSVSSGGPALEASPVTDVAGRVALALRFAPKDAAAVERLVGIVERSALPSERQQAIV
ncbi:MAG: hypothetical protein KC621_21005, partial [Myxococcales bacterium]|nr:hypothetical protein [Myxococcales bacterium]